MKYTIKIPLLSYAKVYGEQACEGQLIEWGDTLEGILDHVDPYGLARTKDNTTIGHVTECVIVVHVDTLRKLNEILEKIEYKHTLIEVF